MVWKGEIWGSNYSSPYRCRLKIIFNPPIPTLNTSSSASLVVLHALSTGNLIKKLFPSFSSRKFQSRVFDFDAVNELKKVFTECVDIA